MDFEVSGPGETPPPTGPNQLAPWEPRLPLGMAHNFGTGCWVGQGRLRRWEEEEFDFLIEFFSFVFGRTHDREHREWEENQLRNAFQQVWNATPFAKEKTWESVPGPSAPYSLLPGRDAEAELAAAV